MDNLGYWIVEHMGWLPKSIRWRIAHFFSDRTDTCWNSWGMWAAYGTEQMLSTGKCHEDAREGGGGSCYCGKIRTDSRVLP